MPVISRLENREGFPFDARPARYDQLAYEAAAISFGKERVDKVLDILHRSRLNTRAIFEDVMTYNVPSPKAQRDDLYYMVLQSIREDLKPKVKTVPYTMGAIPHLPEFPGARSPGLPWKLMGYKTKREVVNVQGNIHTINQTWQHISARKKVELPDVCAFARAQIAKEDSEKIRAVWGYPLHVYMEEARFFYPIMDYIKANDHDLNIAYGIEMAHGGMRIVNEKCSRHKGQYFVSDWKSFDKTIPPWLIRDSFGLLSELVDFDHVIDSEGKIWSVRGERSKRRWKRMVDYFVNTPIRMCNGDRFLVEGGVPSGSCFTNMIDSIVNLIVTRYCVYATTGSFPVDEIILGDDGVYMLSGVVNMEDIAGLALKMFGMVLNVSKSYVTSDPSNVHFLGYFNHEGVPFKNMDFLIASFVLPEHTRSSAVEAASAALGQMWTCFDPYYAAKWYDVINVIANYDNLTHRQIELYLAENAHRHRYLRHVGLDPLKLTIPSPNAEGLILKVMPGPIRTRIKLQKNWNYVELWDRTVSTSFEYEAD